MPHFSGTVTYRRVLESLAPDTQAIELPPGFQDVAELKVNGQPLGVRAWSPYQWRLPSRLHGAVEIEVAVTNTLSQFRPIAHSRRRSCAGGLRRRAWHAARRFRPARHNHASTNPKGAPLRSTDQGATRATLTTLPGRINDIAFDAARGRIYVVSEDSLKRWDGKTWTTFANLPKDQWGGNRISSVAVDPVNPNVIYATSNRDLFASNVSVLRSTDAGATWRNLTLNTPLTGKNRDGGREAICVRVHPRTRYAYVSTSCYGIWKIGPPAPGGR